MVWANAHEYIYSHRNDVSIERLKELAETFEMSPVAEDVGFMSAPRNHNYVSTVFSNLIEPITELYTRMLHRCGSVEPNQVQTSPAENGYAIAIIALATFLLEGACGPARYGSGLDQRRSASDTLRDLGATYLADRIEEVFVVRDVIAHSHLWTANMSWDENGLQFQSEPERLPAYGDKKFERLVDPRSRTTRRLGLDVFPPRIHRHTAITALKECVKALQFLESKDRRFVYLTPIHVQIGGDEIQFYKWVRQLPP
jgi:hypothetical protein